MKIADPMKIKMQKLMNFYPTIANCKENTVKLSANLNNWNNLKKETTIRPQLTKITEKN